MKNLGFSCMIATLFVSLSGCQNNDDPGNRRPKYAISILVDLSQTWHNEVSDPLDLRVLSAVGTSIVGASKKLPKPLSVRYHVIGQASLGREPICAVTFRPSAFALGKAEAGVLKDPVKFENFVEHDCPQKILSGPAEPSTEIIAAIITADRALHLSKEGIPKVYVLLSDFLEDSPAGYDFRGVKLDGAKFILVYRTLPEDRLAPAEQRARVNEWTKRLANIGANVTSIDENAVLTSPKDFEALLRVK